ncbi:cryptochrome/photolyase family protein [Myroides injenensis]|uniref:cryptochrome/photolyase family protein n=1 Tax=Myroides injenensis TaxID=1183151 RepID=UPI000289DAE4|nr:deoxyribodipyrimidine photo-lyase [Myroides injenensis]
MTAKEKIVVYWFRRDLRLKDNVGFSAALQSGYKVLPIFIFDVDILQAFTIKKDRRVDYIYQVIVELDSFLKKYNSGIKVFHSTTENAFESLTNDYDVQGVYCNEDYESKALQRDKQVNDYLAIRHIPFYTFKDHVIFKGGEILKNDNSPYQIYTPYSKQWRSKLNEDYLRDYTIKLTQDLLYPFTSILPTLEDIGYEKSDFSFEIPSLESSIIDDYNLNRDFPSKDATTKLGIALRFGTISVRRCVKYALEHNDVWLSELIWRDFFSQILYLFPFVENRCFKEKYEAIPWRNNEEEFELWCNARTGYPIVDAGMRELISTGFMHNRVRMVVASFLTKHLLIDWRWGEAFFAQYLLDYDLASNNGNWQWAAGCGCDAAPYFRVFNPLEQAKKFDKDNEYIDKWLPEIRLGTYWEPIVEHKFARERAIATYKKFLNDFY